MVFDERVCGRISAVGILVAAVLAVCLPRFTLAEPPGASNAAGSPDAASTTSGGASSASSATTESDGPADPDEPRTTIGRSLRLSKVIRSDEISADKPVEISLGSGGTIRISKNEDGDLVVTVEQTEVSESPRRRRIVINRTGAEDLALDSGRATVTTSRSVERGSGSASSYGARTLSSDTAGPDLDRELLRSDVELAELNVLEQRVKLRIAQKENVDASQRDLAELAVRRAEIELKRAQLRLSRGESTRGRR